MRVQWLVILCVSVAFCFFAVVGAANGPACVAAQQESQESKQQEKSEQGDSKQQESAEQEETNKDKIQRAVQLASNDEFVKAIEIVEEVLKQDVENLRYQGLLLQLLSAQIDALIDEDRQSASPYMIRAAELVRDVAKSRENDTRLKSRLSSFIYQEASCYAIDGQREEAMATLAEAFEWGFDDLEQLTGDEDFDALKDSAEFKKFVDDQIVRIRRRLAEEAAEQFASFESYDFDIELADFDGETVKLEDYEGKVLIVDFWGTWCAPCIAEIPSFIKLKNEFGAERLDILGLTYESVGDETEQIERVKKLMEEKQVNYKCVFGDEDTMSQIPSFQGFPTTLFIDQTGKVRLQLVGQHSYYELEALVKELLKEKLSN